MIRAHLGVKRGSYLIWIVALSQVLQRERESCEKSVIDTSFFLVIIKL